MTNSKGSDSEHTIEAAATRADFVAPKVEVVAEGPGSVIGNYRILERLGEGGFGSVFLAEQERPVKRRVALKIIKLGMDTAEVINRFEAERQALAIMDHPNIAKVYDAGATDRGRPYFVMELVRGTPITAYCDTNRLTIPERLAIFREVCAAVQHAHHKGIIHRDIKPSNILVSSHDGAAVPKVIDFGIAKATGSRLTDHTLHTEISSFIGTPEYMSPEQAEGSLDVDTRTDIYSLGVLLYELLTGSTPFSGKELRSAANREMQRMIREVDPPDPSTRISQSRDSIATVAATRRTDPAKLSSQIKGELDWIVMKALEKDRARRYDSATSFSADILRSLTGEPVVAAPPSTTYRLAKFIRRNKGPVAAVAAVGLTLACGLAAFAWQARVARSERDAAELARADARKHADELQLVSDFQARMLSKINATRAGQQLWSDIRSRFTRGLEKDGIEPDLRERRTTAFMNELDRVSATDAASAMIDRTVLAPAAAAITEQFNDQPRISAVLRQRIGILYQTLGLSAQSLPLAIQSADGFEKLYGTDHKLTIDARSLQASTLGDLGKVDEAQAILRGVLEASTRLNGAENEATLNIMSNFGNLLRESGKMAEAEPLLRGALEGRRKVLGPAHRQTLISMATYGYYFIALGQPEEAAKYWREAYEKGRGAFGPDDPDVLIWAANLGGIATELGNWQESADRYRDAMEGFRRVRGAEHPYTLSCQSSLAFALRRMNRFDESVKVMKDVLEAQRRTLGPENPETLDTMGSIGATLREQGRHAEAEAVLRENLAITRRALGEEHKDTLLSMGALASVLSDLERIDEAETLRVAQIAALERTVGKDHPDYLDACRWYADTLSRRSRFEDAERVSRQVVETRARVSGDKARETTFARVALGQTLQFAGKLEEAEQIVRRALEDIKGPPGRGDLRYAEIQTVLADILRERGGANLDEAIKIATEAAAALEPKDGQNALNSCASKRVVGRIQILRGQYADAEKNLLKCQETEQAAGITLTARGIRTLRSLAQLYNAWNDKEPARGHDAAAARWKAAVEEAERANPGLKAVQR